MPAHTAVGVATMVMVGRGTEVMRMVLLPAQPLLSPSTVKMVVAVMVTMAGLLWMPPGFQVYELAPVAESAVVNPSHTEVLEALTLITGIGLTYWVKKATFEQPGPLEPSTV